MCNIEIAVWRRRWAGLWWTKRWLANTGKYHEIFSFFLVLYFYNGLRIWHYRHYQDLKHTFLLKERRDIDNIERCLGKSLFLFGLNSNSRLCLNQLSGIDLIFQNPKYPTLWSIRGMPGPHPRIQYLGLNFFFHFSDKGCCRHTSPETCSECNQACLDLYRQISAIALLFPLEWESAPNE